MKRAPWILLAGLLGAALSSGLPANQAKANQAEVALQAAIKAETVDGDLRGAIELYRKLAGDGDRAVAAKALVRMGQCYEKLGDAQARQAYDRVVRDFADQKETVDAAKARLAALNRPAEVPPLAVRRVWAGSDVNTDGAPSWDGRFLTFTNQASGAVSLRNLSTGETRELGKASADLQSPAGRSLISPDGKKVAYARSSGDGFFELRLINLDGSGERIFFRSDRLVSLKPCVWSADGARIVAASATKDESAGIEVNRIVLISLGDGSARILQALGSRRPEPRGISPDGRFIAYDCPPREDSESRDIFLLAADGSREVTLVEHPADDQLLGWAPDGRGVLFASDRAGQWGAWFLRIADGKPAGQPVSIRPEMEPAEPLGFTRGGSLYYGVESGGTDAYVVELDPTASRMTAAPALINERFAGRNRLPLYSPDGRSLAYFSNRSADRWTLCIRSLSAGGDREFLAPRDLERLRIARWTPGGQGILVSGFDKLHHHMGFYEMDARNGDARAILSSNPETDTLDGQWAPDGKSFYLTRAGFAFADAAPRILQRDPATGSEKEIYRLSPGEDVTNLALSPDGLELAFTARSRRWNGSCDRLGIVSAQGENARELLRLSGREAVRRDGLVWTPDGRYLLFAKTVEAAPRSFRLELWRASPRGQEAHNVGVLASDMAFGDGASGLRIHPDGKSVAFQAGRRKPEVWVMENVLPATKAGPVPEFLDEVTLEAWINFSSLGPELQAIAVKGTHNYDGVSCAIYLNTEGRLHLGIRHCHTSFGESGDWSIECIVGDAVLHPNTWYHVAGTVYSSRSASIYLNGALMKTGAITQSILARPTEPLYIGLSTLFGVPSYRFNGTVDGAALYERVLSANEIRQHYQAGLPTHRNQSR
ncbi:MAG: hypothetical protein NTZ26_02615 [Candidatus Aminicenantes bacterium]|nr:hypothetical protein [Candidatus Aminicenantes bacterium]